MSLLDFESNPLWLNGAVFLAAAGVILFAGTKLERYADAIADVTGIGKAFLGLLLLAVVTSLPEIAAVATATLAGNPRLAVNNLAGAVVINAVVLAVADFSFGRGPITRASPDYSLLILGVGLVALLGVALMGMALGKEFGFQVPWVQSEYTVGAWSLGLLGAYLLMLYLTYRGQKNPRWQIIKRKKHKDEQEEAPPELQEPEAGDEASPTLRRLLRLTSAAALAVLVAGYLLGRSGDSLAKQTGLGATFVGATMMAVATCLPEMTTTTNAVRHGNYQMAIGNIFGSSAFNVVLLVLVAALAGSGDTLDAMTQATQFAIALGIVLNCVYLWGLLERDDRTVFRMGLDAATVLALAIGGYWIIYLLR